MKAGFGQLIAAIFVAGSPLAYADCCAPTTADWPKYGGNLGNTSFSGLTQINTTNVRKLGAAWLVHVSGSGQQGAPVVVNGVMYVQGSGGVVLALNAKTGAEIWRATGLGESRGVAVGEGLVFVPTRSPQRVTALNQATGAIVWQKSAADLTAMGVHTEVINGVPRTFGGGGAPGPLVYYNGLLYVGTGGGDGAYRGRAYAMRGSDGAVMGGRSGCTQFWDRVGSATTRGKVRRGTRGGAAPWMHPAIDPETNTVYFTFGNASPKSKAARAPATTSSRVPCAMDAKTGAYKWHFQATARHLGLRRRGAGADTTSRPRGAAQGNGHPRQDRWLYMFDRVTGQPLVGSTRPGGQNAQNKTAATQPIPRGDPFSPLSG